MMRTSTSFLVFPLIALAAASGCVVKEVPETNPCDPNPCTEANKARCEVVEDEAVCLCNAGFVTRPSGACEPVSDANCPSHSGDSAEPDDC